MINRDIERRMYNLLSNLKKNTKINKSIIKEAEELYSDISEIVKEGSYKQRLFEKIAYEYKIGGYKMYKPYYKLSNYFFGPLEKQLWVETTIEDLIKNI